MYQKCRSCASDHIMIDELKLQKSSNRKGVKGVFAMFCETCGDIGIYGITDNSKKANKEMRRLTARYGRELNTLAQTASKSIVNGASKIN